MFFTIYNTTQFQYFYKMFINDTPYLPLTIDCENSKCLDFDIDKTIFKTNNKNKTNKYYKIYPIYDENNVDDITRNQQLNLKYNELFYSLCSKV